MEAARGDGESCNARPFYFTANSSFPQGFIPKSWHPLPDYSFTLFCANAQEANAQEAGGNLVLTANGSSRARLASAFLRPTRLTPARNQSANT